MYFLIQCLCSAVDELRPSARLNQGSYCCEHGLHETGIVAAHRYLCTQAVPALHLDAHEYPQATHACGGPLAASDDLDKHGERV